MESHLAWCLHLVGTLQMTLLFQVPLFPPPKDRLLMQSNHFEEVKTVTPLVLEMEFDGGGMQGFRWVVKLWEGGVNGSGENGLNRKEV